MIEIGQRIKQVREEKRLTQEAFGRRIDLTKQAIANVENERCNPSIEFIGKLFCNFDVNLNWLFSGKGEMFNESAQQDEQLEELVARIVDKKMKERGLI